MTFHLGLLFSSAQCFSLAFHVFWVLIFHIARTGIITWGGLASLWPDLLFSLVTLVSFWEWWADGNGTSLPTFLLWKLKKCVSLMSLPLSFHSSLFPFQFSFCPPILPVAGPPGGGFSCHLYPRSRSSSSIQLRLYGWAALHGHC